MKKKNITKILKPLLKRLLTGWGLIQTIIIVTIYAALTGYLISSQADFNEKAIAGQWQYCDSSSACPQGYSCLNNKCNPPGCCRDKSDCQGPWEECIEGNGACSTNKSCRSKQGCEKDSDCIPDFRCINGRCQKDDGSTPDYIQCMADSNGVRTSYNTDSDKPYPVTIKYVLCKREFDHTLSAKNQCYQNPFCGKSPSTKTFDDFRNKSFSHGFGLPLCGPWQTDIRVTHNGNIVCQRSDHGCSWNDAKCLPPLTPTPTPTPRVTPTPTLTPTPTPTGTITPTQTPTPTPTGTLTPTQTPTPTPTPGEEIKKCYEECQYDEDCEGDLFCEEVSGIKRCVNIDCPDESDCICPDQEPTPTKAGVIKGEVITHYPPTGTNTYLTLTLISGAAIAALFRILLLFL